MASGEDAALPGLGGELLLEGETGEFVGRSGNYRAYAGLAPDLFAIECRGGNAWLHDIVLQRAKNSTPEAFVNRTNFFANRNVSAITCWKSPEIALIEEGTVEEPGRRLHSSVMRPEVQVSTAGSLPMITHIFLSDHSKGDLKEAFNRSLPWQTIGLNFPEPIAAFVRNMTTYANTSGNHC